MLKVTYKDVIAQYSRYVKANYGSLRINFDRDNESPAIKDREHLRRVARTSANIEIEDGLRFSVHEELFL